MFLQIPSSTFFNHWKPVSPALEERIFISICHLFCNSLFRGTLWRLARSWALCNSDCIRLFHWLTYSWRCVRHFVITNFSNISAINLFITFLLRWKEHLTHPESLTDWAYSVQITSTPYFSYSNLPLLDSCSFSPSTPSVLLFPKWSRSIREYSQAYLSNYWLYFSRGLLHIDTRSVHGVRAA